MLKQNDDPRFVQLMKALAAGWEIDEPVLVRATWRETNSTSGTYHFVLRQKTQDRTTLLSLPLKVVQFGYVVVPKLAPNSDVFLLLKLKIPVLVVNL